MMPIPLPAENVPCQGKSIRKICQGKLHSALILLTFSKLYNWSMRSCLVGLIFKYGLNCVYGQLIVGSQTSTDLIDLILKPDTYLTNVTVCICHNQVL